MIWFITGLAMQSMEGVRQGCAAHCLLRSISCLHVQQYFFLVNPICCAGLIILFAFLSPSPDTVFIPSAICFIVEIVGCVHVQVGCHPQVAEGLSLQRQCISFMFYHYQKTDYPWQGSPPTISLRGEIEPQGYTITLGSSETSKEMHILDLCRR